jgi:multidrug efflux pump subunit AcrB
LSLPESAIKKRTFTIFATAVIFVAGLASYFQLGQLEDPEFTIKSAAVTATYPGATAKEVELEVTDRLEKAIQQMPQVKEIESLSRPGLSIINITFKSEYKSNQLPQIYDVLRGKIKDIEPHLPPGAGTPDVADDFADVYGFLMAVVADGFEPRELESYVDLLKKELSLVKGVGRVELWGVQTQCLYLDISEARLSQLGLSVDDIKFTLATQNAVIQSGAIDLSDERLRIEVSGAYTSPTDIEELVIRGRGASTSGESADLLRIRDFATVSRGYMNPPLSQMRHNGLPSIGVAISNASGENIVKLGERLDARLKELIAEFPIGIEVRRIGWQSNLVAKSMDDFMVSLLQAVAIVLVVLWFAMGWRAAMIVGLTGLLLVIVMSFVVMKLTGVDLHRMSLGALVIAMGMMVDNAIVVADGIIVRVQGGMDRTKAAIQSASQPSMALLGATVIAVMAFYPIAASSEGAGEYCATLFSVVAISLVISWVLSMTIAPVMCIAMLPKPKVDAGDPYSGVIFQLYRKTLCLVIRFRYPFALILVGVLIISMLGFKFVNQMFFPASARQQLMIDYWAPQGSSIDQVSRDIAKLEQQLIGNEDVKSVSTFLGQGPPRFYLPVESEKPYPSYGQLIVNTNSYEGVTRTIERMQEYADANVPEARVVIRRYGLGPSETWPIQAVISGPALADPKHLRDLAKQVSDIMAKSPEARIVRDNWRQRVKKIVTDFDEKRGRWAMVSRKNVGDATRRAFDGLPIGQFREKDKMLPILIRHMEADRETAAMNLASLQIYPGFRTNTVPLAQVSAGVGIEWEDELIWRRDRRRAITVQGLPRGLATKFRDDVAAEIDALQMPPGYSLLWDGEYRSSKDSQASLVPGLIPAAAIMAIVIVGLFNAYRPALIILLVVPFALVGVTIGLLVTGQPFGFVALLGALSLAGMMIKNAIVLLDQVNIEKGEGKSDYDAVINAAMSRFRPVMLAAGTTILGVVPLLQDVFWVSMSVTIMFGLAVGSVLTMLIVPVLYAIFYRLPKEAPSS